MLATSSLRDCRKAHGASARCRLQKQQPNRHARGSLFRMESSSVVELQTFEYGDQHAGSDRCHCISRDTCVWRGEKIKESRKKRPMEGEGEVGCWHPYMCTHCGTHSSSVWNARNHLKPTGNKHVREHVHMSRTSYVTGRIEWTVAYDANGA